MKLHGKFRDDWIKKAHFRNIVCRIGDNCWRGESENCRMRQGITFTTLFATPGIAGLAGRFGEVKVNSRRLLQLSYFFGTQGGPEHRLCQLANLCRRCLRRPVRGHHRPFFYTSPSTICRKRSSARSQPAEMPCRKACASCSRCVFSA